MRRDTRPSPYEEFAALSAEEKEAVYRECDDELLAARAHRLDPEMRAYWRRAKRRRGKPATGAEVVLRIDRDLLREADRLARTRRLTRSQLFSRSVQAVLAMAG
jgi:hypothetical protein